MAFYQWSLTPASNANADTTINWAEGQAPSSVNDSARAEMTRLREWGNDIAGAIVTAGTNVAYTVTSNQAFDTLAHLSGQVIAFTPHATNAATVTLNVDSLGAKPLRNSPGVELQSGVLIQGTPYAALYNNSDGAFYLFGVGASPGIPIAGGMDYWSLVTPGSAWAFPAGQAISRTTYSKLFTLIGVAYGSGDGSTTFNLPDKTGRVSAMIEATPTRLTSTYFGGTSNVLNAVGGGESRTLLTANLPAYTPTGTITNGAISVPVNNYINNGGQPGGGGSAGTLATAPVVTQGSSTFTGAAQGGTSTPYAIVQPTIICNYIIRII